MSKNNIIENYLNYDLSKEDLDKLSIDKVALQQIDVAALSDKLSKEFFNPGYDSFMTGKKEHFRQLVHEERQINSAPPKAGKPIAAKNILLLVLAAIILTAIVTTGTLIGKTEKVTVEEVKQYAMLSYESTGAIDANRGGSQAPNQLKSNYELLINGSCNELTINGKYVEQELWSQLYCAYLNNDDKMIEHYKSQIIDNKYFNYRKLN